MVQIFAGQSTAALLRLPPEILEQILSELDEPYDLLSFAFASHACSRLAIPTHTQYRVLRLRTPMPELWAHLAERADLARHIREVRFCSRMDRSSRDRFPYTLVNSDAAKYPGAAEERTKNIVCALAHMSRLRKFTWNHQADVKSGQPVDRALEEVVCGVLARAPGLRQLRLSGLCADHVRHGMSRPGVLYPLWEVSGLTAISLVGHGWARDSNADSVVAMLHRSPDVEFLAVPAELNGLHLCRFPRLKKLVLEMVAGTAGAATHLDNISLFLENHPTIEELSWYPVGAVKLSPGTLPALKRLKGPRQIFDAMEESGSSWPLEDLDIWSLGFESLSAAMSLDPTTVRKVSITTAGTIESIWAFAERFRAITWLSLPAYYISETTDGPQRIPIEQWLDILQRFPNLEVLRGLGMWNAVGESKERMHQVILDLVERCPNLRELDYLRVCPEHGNYKVIKIIRERDPEDSELEHVRYEVHKPKLWDWLDTMAGRFN
ncbi:hypothetical protein H0H81_005774 [Sphagnurus paluster]|uniref:F-box domain-containing protein n=1 Tax=Sphagnurus paluster TaxID=117069 RepID=A0A9P7K3T0_9AGAR|nr:hypothetical protein H0H81_005774 [Sphagnurus paluster]